MACLDLPPSPSPPRRLACRLRRPQRDSAGRGRVSLSQLFGGAPITPSNARFFAAPLPVVLHIVAAFVFTLVGAFQFAPALRRRRPGWHRVAGRFVFGAGMVVALSGLWMTLFYARPPGDGDLLTAMRLGFGTGMAAALVAGLLAVLRRDLVARRAAMIRGYAIGMGAGTQVLTNVPWILLVGPPSELTRAVLMGAGWVINLAVAEVVIRRQGRSGGAAAVRAAAVRAEAIRRPASTNRPRPGH
jgi:hypothetical protein